MPVKALFVLLFLMLSLAACEQNGAILQRHEGTTMGTHFSVQWSANSAQENQAISGEINRRLAELNQSMSTYIEDSEISRFNRSPAGTRIEISNYFSEVMKLAIEISKLTHGAFDFTVGPLVSLWGFGPLETGGRRPDDDAIQALMSKVGYQSIRLDESARRLSKQQDSTIDLSAIAKGYAVDVIARLLESKGINHYLVEIGGELRAAGFKPGGAAWRIGIESPTTDERDLQLAIEVSNISVATSGDYRNYFEEQGVRYSHTIDPTTGRPITHDLVSVTVLENTCIRADALATALLVMGPEKGLEFAEQQGISAYFIVKTESDFEARWTEGFSAYLENN